MSKKAIALVDCDNFFVSCERLFRPELHNVPVLVLSSNDGCVVSRSQEVKQIGISMGVPFFTVRDVCKKEHVTVFSSNFELYRDISRRVMSVLHRFSDTVETYSIDEAFLQLDCLSEKKLCTQAEQLQQVIHREVGVPVSVGIASTKTLAKLSARSMKPGNTKTRFQTLVTRDMIERALQVTDVTDVWGIGKQSVRHLNYLGVRTAYDLVQFVTSDAGRGMHVGIGRTVQELSGRKYFQVDREGGEVRKSLMNSQSFSGAVYRECEVRSAVARHARATAEMLRAENVVAREVSVFVYVKGNHGKHTCVRGTEVLETYASDTITFVAIAEKLLGRLYKRGVSYVKAGVVVRDIVRSGAQPKTTLFHENAEKNSELMNVIDTLKNKRGITVQTATELGESTWRPKREKLSPRYTTRWSEVKVV